MISFIAIANSIGATYTSGGSPGVEFIVTEGSTQIITEASSQNMITE